METVLYDGRHSVIFSGKHSWTDWQLVPASRLIIPPPAMNVKDVEIPGRSGKIDLSNFQAGHLTYKNRSATVSFFVPNQTRDWTATYSNIVNHLLGKQIEVVLTDDPSYYYFGYCTPVIGNGEGRLVVQISMDLDPFKRKVYLNSELKDIQLSGSKSFILNGTIAYDCPTIWTSDPITVLYNEKKWEVESGKHTLYDLQLGPGSHEVTLSGNATVTFDFRGGVF